MDNDAAEMLKYLVNNNIRIHTRFVQHVIRCCDKKIISLMLDNIPTDEYYSCFYAAVIKWNRSTDIIDLLFDRKVPMSDDTLIFCIDENKLDYIEYFVNKDPKIISFFVLKKVMNNYDLLKYFAEKIKEHKLYIDNYELVIRKMAQQGNSIDTKCRKILENLQGYNLTEVIFYNESKEKEICQSLRVGVIKRNT